MRMLLASHDAYCRLKDIMQSINGGREDVGIIGQMNVLETLLVELSPIYDKREDVSNQSLFWRNLLDSTVDMDQRVKTLMGM